MKQLQRVYVPQFLAPSVNEVLICLWILRKRYTFANNIHAQRDVLKQLFYVPSYYIKECLDPFKTLYGCSVYQYLRWVWYWPFRDLCDLSNYFKVTFLVLSHFKECFVLIEFHLHVNILQEFDIDHIVDFVDLLNRVKVNLPC